MLPAIVVILFCQVLATVGLAGVSAAGIKDPNNRARAGAVVVLLAILTLLPAGWQTAEVINSATRSPFSKLRGY